MQTTYQLSPFWMVLHPVCSVCSSLTDRVVILIRFKISSGPKKSAGFRQPAVIGGMRYDEIYLESPEFQRGAYGEAT